MKPLLKVSTVDGQSVEDTRNFPKVYGLIAWIRNSGRDLKIWDHLSESKDGENGNTRLKKKNAKVLCREGSCYSPTLYRDLTLSYPTDVASIVLDGRMTTEIDTGSLVQSARLLLSADFRPVCD